MARAVALPDGRAPVRARHRYLADAEPRRSRSGGAPRDRPAKTPAPDRQWHRPGRVSPPPGTLTPRRAARADLRGTLRAGQESSHAARGGGDPEAARNALPSPAGGRRTAPVRVRGAVPAARDRRAG